MINDDFIRHNLIQDYLNGKLTGEALADFQQQLQNDPSLGQELVLMRNMQRAFTPDDEQVKAVRQTLKDIHEEQSRPVNKTRWLGTRWMALAAAILLLLVFFFLLPQSNDPASLYTEYATHTSLSLTKKSKDDNTAFQLEQAFNQQQYDKALNETITYLSKVPNAYDVLLAKGICQLELDQYSDALKTFQQVKQTDLRINKGYWYIALTYLKMKEKEKCKAVLHDIISSKSYNHTKAKELLQKL